MGNKPTKTYDVWREGYEVSGNSSKAVKVATVDATDMSFKTACAKHFKNDSTYNSVRNTLWGCQLFDNEADARESFG